MRFVAFAAALVAAPLAAQSSNIAAFEAARSEQLTPGAWTYRLVEGGSESRFGNSFVIHCDRTARTVSLRRAEPIAASPAVPLTIVTDTQTRTLAAGGAALRATDSLLDAIAFSRGRFIVTGGGGVKLVLPAWPDAARSIEDCRN